MITYQFNWSMNGNGSIYVLPSVNWVIADSYLNMKTQDYGGEPFIMGKAVPYDPKYHLAWELNIRTLQVELNTPPLQHPKAKREAQPGLDVAGSPPKTKKFHAELIKTGLIQHHPLSKSLVDAYGKCGMVQDVLKLFETLPHQDHAAWSTILSACNISSNVPHRTLSLLVPILHTDLIPDNFIFSSVVKSCGKLSPLDAKIGKSVHCRFLRSNVSEDDCVKANLVGMYSNYGLPNYGRHVFNTIDTLTFISWTSMIYGYARSGQKSDALQLFNESPHKNLKAYNILISGLVEGGNPYDGCYMFIRMISEGVCITDPLVISSLLRACATIDSLQLGKQLHGIVLKLGHDSCFVTSESLVEMYVKCSNLE